MSAMFLGIWKSRWRMKRVILKIRRHSALADENFSRRQQLYFILGRDSKSQGQYLFLQGMQHLIFKRKATILDNLGHGIERPYFSSYFDRPLDHHDTSHVVEGCRHQASQVVLNTELTNPKLKFGTCGYGKVLVDRRKSLQGCLSAFAVKHSIIASHLTEWQYVGGDVPYIEAAVLYTRESQQTAKRRKDFLVLESPLDFTWSMHVSLWSAWLCNTNDQRRRRASINWKVLFQLLCHNTSYLLASQIKLPSCK